MKQVFKECKVNNVVCRRVPLVIPTSCMQMAKFLQSKILDARLHGLFGCKNDGSGQKKKTLDYLQPRKNCVVGIYKYD